MNIAIYGLGNFGYSFLRYFDRKNDGSLILTAYDHKPERIVYLRRHRRHPILYANTKLSTNINFVDNTKDLIENCDIVIVAVPSTATREAMNIINKTAKKPLVVINTAKALHSKTGERLSQISQRELENFNHQYAVISGGTVASDIFEGQPLGATIACKDSATLQKLKSIFESSTLFIESSADLAGVEYAGAFKNIISILAGTVSGLGMSYGTETHIISRTAGQIADVCVRELGAKQETFSIQSQCWGNDMWMSATGKTRNREFGLLLGSGMGVDRALARMAAKQKIVEGLNTVAILPELPAIYEIPILKLLHEVTIEKTKSVDSIKQYIMSLY